MVDALVTEAVVCLPPSPHDLVLASVVTTQPLLSDALITVGLSFGGLGGAFRCFRVGGVRWRVGSDPGVFDLGLLLSWFVAGVPRQGRPPDPRTLTPDPSGDKP
jgi:hypothetical protein